MWGMKFLWILVCMLILNLNLSTKETNGRRVAIVIGINRYKDPSFRSLLNARNDASKIAEVLKEKGKFDEVLHFSDENDTFGFQNPTKLNIEKQYEELIARIYPEDLLFFYFSGHGIGDGYGNNYILPSDTLETKRFSTSISVKSLLDKLQKRKIKKALFIFDACRSSMSYQKSNEENFSSKNEDPQVVGVLYSTRPGQYSYEDNESPHGVFTRYLIAGLKGDADVDKDLIVTLQELRKFVEMKMKDHFPIGDERRQAPSLKIPNETYGDLFLTYLEEKDLNSSHDPALEYKSQIQDQYIYPFLDTIASVSILGYHDMRRGDPFTGKFLFWSGAILGGYLYQEHNSYINTKNEFDSLGSFILLAPYPYDLFAYGSYNEMRNQVNKKSKTVQNNGLILVFIYLINSYRVGSDTLIYLEKIPSKSSYNYPTFSIEGNSVYLPNLRTFNHEYTIQYQTTF
jgi:hypothetical protein